MQTSLIQYYQNGDISLMKQFLLTFPIFNEIHYYLGNEKFYEFLQCVSVHPVFYSAPFELNAMSTYLFMSTGLLIPKKQKKQNFHRLSRLSRSVKFTHIMMAKETFNLQHQRQSQKIKTIQINELYNLDHLYNPSFTGQNHIFVSNQQQKSAIVQLNMKQVPEHIFQDLRQKHNQKLKFIENCDIFKNVQRYLIENNLSKFHVLKVSFDQCLLKHPKLRTNHVFFLTAGEVQILVDQKENRKTYLTKAPAVVGFERIKCAKSVTECCSCFYIEKSQVADILKKNMEGKYRNPTTEQNLKILLKSMRKEHSSIGAQNSFTRIAPTQLTLPAAQFYQRHQRTNTTPVSPIEGIQQSQRPLFKSKQNLIKTLNQKVTQNKKYRIKEHFSNFLSDKYSQFVVKKTQFLKKKCNNDDSVLYEMKTLTPKEPQMSSINQRLKLQRLNRLDRCKQNILYTKEESLNLVNLRMYQEFEDTKIISKIRRKLETNISRKQHKNKHWKSYVPNTVCFNRMSDLSLSNC